MTLTKKEAMKEMEDAYLKQKKVNDATQTLSTEEYMEALRLVTDHVQAKCKGNGEILGALNRLYLCVSDEWLRKDQEDQWSSTFPTEEGLYWFFGQDFGQKHSIYLQEICLNVVEVWRTANGYAHILRGHFIYPSEAVGVWLPMTLPEFPKE